VEVLVGFCKVGISVGVCDSGVPVIAIIEARVFDVSESSGSIGEGDTDVDWGMELEITLQEDKRKRMTTRLMSIRLCRIINLRDEVVYEINLDFVCPNVPLMKARID
jgi:hypothetical protein